MTKNIHTLLIAGIVMFFAAGSYANDNPWEKFEGKTAPSRLPMTVKPKDYRIFTLDQQYMLSFLSGLSTNYDEGKSMLLPTPDNKFRTFHVWKTPMMEPALAALHPEIQTFTAVAEDDQQVTAKLDYTLYGFRAMVFDGSKSFYLDPYSRDADGYYIAFYTSYFSPSFHGNCGANTGISSSDNGIPTTINTGGGQTIQKVNGTKRRTFRLAMSCTGEYATTVTGMANPSIAQVVNIIVSTVNRINGVYEREVAESFTLAANNNNIVYTNPATDPFSTGEAGNNQALLGRGGNIDTVIGKQNYDIGHTLSNVGGGIAQLNTLCANSNKAFSAAGSDGPDDIIAVTHELAHQHSAKHTFQSKGGQCGQQQSPDDGYEPGGGGSLMSYANVCTGDVVQEGQSLYWHVHNLQQITDYVATVPTCGTLATGSPGIIIPAIPTGPFYIPKETPFELTAPVATAVQSSGAVTYCWEQFDIGNAGGKEVENNAAVQGPSLRSFYPDTAKVRSHPQLSMIFDNSYTGPGERLPKNVRNLNFKLTARSIYQGWGTFQYIDNNVVLRVDSTSSRFRVTSQDTAESWNPGERKLIKWDVAGTDNDSVNCKWVNIYLSRDNGLTFPYLLVSNAPNTGSYTVTVPNLLVPQARVKVKGAGNMFFDINKAAITINGDPTGVKDIDPAAELSIYPNPASGNIHILSGDASTLKVALYNVIGQRMWHGNLSKVLDIPVHGFARGTYLLQVVNTNTGAQSAHKIVLQ